MITIEKDAKQIMFEDALQAFPDECCGFMFGVEDDSQNRVVSRVLSINNSAVENRKRRFEIAPKDYLKGEQFAMAEELQFIGIYHSHPDHPAIPSEHDRVAAQPWFSYVIISVSKDGVKNVQSWRLNNDSQFEEEIYSDNIVNTTN